MDTFEINLIKRHEGLRLKPYRCSSGKLTIGWGRNLEDRGITQEEADYLFQNDVTNAEHGAMYLVNNWNKLTENRKAVLIDMVFQIGYVGVEKFKRTLRAIEEEDFKAAARYMLESKWAEQTPERAEEDARLMEEG